MKNITLPIPTVFLFAFVVIVSVNLLTTEKATGAPPYDISGQDNVTLSEEEALLRNWRRPEGQAKVGLQVGHWKNEEVPEELKRLRGNTGATGGGMTEAEVNMAVAEEAAVLLKAQGITVDILPATVQENYWADVFVAIHADGSEDILKSGYKLASPRRHVTGNSAQLSKTIEKTYGETTGLELDPNVTRNMRGYYAFSWRRFDHAVHPMTASVILETGFLTSPSDRELIVDQPEVSAEGLAAGVIEYLTAKNLL